jgi:hypothetical protein
MHSRNYFIVLFERKFRFVYGFCFHLQELANKPRKSEQIQGIKIIHHNT